LIDRQRENALEQKSGLTSVMRNCIAMGARFDKTSMADTNDSLTGWAIRELPLTPEDEVST